MEKIYEVNIEKGLTGKETYAAYGLYRLYDDALTNKIPKVEALLNTEPKTETLDIVTKAYIESYRKLAPLVTKANKYYDREDYKDDDFALGKELHPQLVEAFTDFMSKRKEFEIELKNIKKQADIISLKKVEKELGKNSYAWQKRNLFLVIDNILEKLDDDNLSLDELNQIVKHYSEVSREFDDYVATAKDISSWNSDKGVNEILVELRKYRDGMKKHNSKKNNEAIRAHGRIIRTYNHMITFSRY